MLRDLRKEIENAKDPARAVFLMRFFKTGVGQYGEDDVFYGIDVPTSRKLSVKYKVLPLHDVQQLLQSKVHEERLIAVFILVRQFESGDEKVRQETYAFYLKNTKYINNWDIVDSSADRIVGEYLYAQRDPHAMSDVLIKLAKSDDLWERRIAIMSTFACIKHGDSLMTFIIADILLHDTHDLIHKAVGWMLREVGKRIMQSEEEIFLRTRYKTMPRTMLRYAIEHFPPEKRKRYLLGTI